MIYPYKCSTCSIEFEIERSIHAESSAPNCPECKTEMVRIWSSPSITFRGTGFYSTDK